MIVDPRVIVHPRLLARHEEGGRLLAALVPARSLPDFEGEEEPLGELAILLLGDAEGVSRDLGELRPHQHVPGNGEVRWLLVAAPPHAPRSRAAELVLSIQGVYLPDLPIHVRSQEGSEGDTDRHALIEEGEALSAEIAVDRPWVAMPRHQETNGAGLPAFDRAVETATPNSPVRGSHATVEKV